MLIDQTAGVKHHLALIRREHHGRSLYFPGIPGPGREVVGALIRFECFDESLCETDGWIAHIGFPPVAVGKHNTFNGRELGPLHPCPRLDSVPAHDIRPEDSGAVSKFDRIEDSHIRFVAGWDHRRQSVSRRVKQLGDGLGRTQIIFMTQWVHGRRLLRPNGRIQRAPVHATWPYDDPSRDVVIEHLEARELVAIIHSDNRASERVAEDAPRRSRPRGKPFAQIVLSMTVQQYRLAESYLRIESSESEIVLRH